MLSVAIRSQNTSQSRSRISSVWSAGGAVPVSIQIEVLRRTQLRRILLSETYTKHTVDRSLVVSVRKFPWCKFLLNANLN